MSENNVASRGDFRGDFSRDTFDPMKHFSRVLMQQGRVQLDADWNEQVSILLHYMRQLGADLMGPHGVPCDYEGNKGKGFEITATEKDFDFSVASGRYYVNGILCEIGAEQNVTYRTQPNYPITDTEELNNGLTYLVYLDVWERHLTYVEDDSMREKALGGADTATRAQVVWQVQVIQKSSDVDNTYQKFTQALITAKAKQPGTGTLKAQARNSGDDKKPCLASPESTYRGAENQLYRVEIHKGSAAGTATFKWSRENGSVIFPITAINVNTISLRNFGHDDRFSLQQGDWVEVLDDDVILRNEANPLLKVTEVDRENLQVTLSDTPNVTLHKNSDGQIEKHPYLRRWDHSKKVTEAGVITVTEGVIPAIHDVWIPLEDGIEVQFDNGTYQTSDYWLIPARTATGDVEWPGTVGNPEAVLPHGVVHHYAPLAIITVNTSNVTVDVDLRRQLNKGWS